MVVQHVGLAAHPYDIIIAKGSRARLGELVAEQWSPRRVLIVSDTNVAPHYLAEVERQLVDGGFGVRQVVIAGGEASKTLSGAQAVYSALIEAGFSRSDGILALGGGVVGDLAGFVASTFMRGLAFIQVPTSLLAQVDASVGGKTAVDFGSGKNVIGTFYQPDLVVIDADYLQTLSQRHLVEGYGEIVKMAAMAADPAFWRLVETIDSPAALLTKAEACCRHAIAGKVALVEADERDTGARRLLNFGHTLGHAVELLVPDTLHGEAVAMGLVAITRICERRGLTAAGTTAAIAARLTAVGLPTTFPQLPVAQIVKQIQLDKKGKDKQVVLVTLKTLGQPALVPVALADLQAFLTV